MILLINATTKNKDNNNKNRPDKKVGYLKMKVICNLKSETINQKIEIGVELATDIVTVNYSSYKKISLTVINKAYKVDKAN